MMNDTKLPVVIVLLTRGVLRLAKVGDIAVRSVRTHWAP
jgi:hypothetical protein